MCKCEIEKKQLTYKIRTVVPICFHDNFRTADAPFEVTYVLKALDPLPHSSPVYQMLKVTDRIQLEDYLREHPNAISWKTVAEVLYRCGEETLLNTLFTYMKSPEGKLLWCFQHCLILCF